MSLEYHIPDDRWETFGLPDYESYLKSVLVKGLFCSKVPKDIIEAFTVCEYMMAHAYYHYPLYDEAMSKVLRTIEMAVKFRCKDLNIPLEVTHASGKAPKKRVLKLLMDEVSKAEPLKDLEWRFTVTRNLRNSLMHPDRHSYSGAMSRDFIKGAVTVLNTLFLPESMFKTIKERVVQKNSELSAFKNGLCILHNDDKRYLIEEVDIKAATFAMGHWHYLLIGIPIMLNPLENLTEHRYLQPLAFVVNDLRMSDLKIIAKEGASNIEISIYHTSNPENLKIYNDYLEALQKVEPVDLETYKHYMKYEAGKLEADFYYKHLWKVEDLTNTE